MTGRYPRPGWSHRSEAVARDVFAIAGCIAVLALTALHLYEAVVALLVGLLILGAAVLFATRPSPAHVDAWRRNHRNRVGDRW